MIQEIVHQDDDGSWYFWEETWAVRHGPYDTRGIAKKALDFYCQEEGLSLPESYIIKETKDVSTRQDS